jgi:hypothetical protein
MSKQRTATLGPWPAGICNSARDYALPKGAALDALNVDFNDEGHASSRIGYSQTVAIDNGHSLRTIGGKTLIGIGTTLGVITAMDSLTVTTLRTGMDLAPVSYAERGGEVWWSNGVQSGRCNADNSDHPWAVPAPANIPTVFAGVGTLPPGTYRIAITHTSADGEESHASDIYSYDLASTGSIVVTLPAATASADDFHVYCTVADGKVLQLYSIVSTATGSVTITAAPTGNELGRRAFLRPLPAGDAICFHGGRLLSLSGEFLYYSDPYDYGLYDPATGVITMGATGSILASVESGVFVAADRTWFYAGADIAIADPVEKLAFGAAAGTVFDHPTTTSPAVGWYSEEGIVIGAADGSVTLPQRDKGFIAPVATSGVAWVRQRDGMAHVVISLDGSASYNKQVSTDFTAARIRYDDDATCVCLNLANGATSRYASWYFNSYANFDGDEYGIDSVGLRLLEGSDDEGTAIQATVDCGLVGYGTPNIKAPECAYVTGKSSAPLVIDIALPSGTIYSYPARTYSEDPKVIRHDGMKGLMNVRTPWFSTVIRNEDGGSLEVSSVLVLINESNRRI